MLVVSCPCTAPLAEPLPTAQERLSGVETTCPLRLVSGLYIFKIWCLGINAEDSCKRLKIASGRKDTHTIIYTA